MTDAPHAPKISQADAEAAVRTLIEWAGDASRHGWTVERLDWAGERFATVARTVIPPPADDRSLVPEMV